MDKTPNQIPVSTSAQPSPAANIPTDTIPVQTSAPVNPETTKKELETVTAQEILSKVEQKLLRILSLVLLFHGTLGLYDELIQIFYVFPYIPQVLEYLNYSQSAFEAVYRRSIILGATALLETIYGVILSRRQKSLAHRIHLISGVGLLIASYISVQVLQPLDLESVGNIPTPPTSSNLFKQSSLDSALNLF